MDFPQLIPSTLDAVWKQSWDLLQRGSVDKKDPFQALTLTTYDGEFPNPRTVILRKILPSTHTLICHTDMRAGKIRDIQAHPKVAWHGWHPKKRVQLRLYGEATIDDSGELWAKEWNRIGFTSRTNYSPIMSPASPVSSFEEGTGTYAKVQTSTEAESEHWKAHFAVISTKIYRLEWLLLNREGHRRALFEEKQGEWEGKWLVP